MAARMCQLVEMCLVPELCYAYLSPCACATADYQKRISPIRKTILWKTTENVNKLILHIVVLPGKKTLLHATRILVTENHFLERKHCTPHGFIENAGIFNCSRKGQFIRDPEMVLNIWASDNELQVEGLMFLSYRSQTEKQATLQVRKISLFDTCNTILQYNIIQPRSDYKNIHLNGRQNKIRGYKTCKNSQVALR